MKKCSKCKVEKEFSEFHKNKASKDGYCSRCKVCRKEYNKQRYQNKREAILEYNKQYIQNNPEVRREKNRKRRAMKNAVQENYTKEDEFYTRQLFAHMCFNCKTTDNLEVDHHYPLSKGHALERDNAVLLCKSCNSSKRNKMPEDFYTELQCYHLDYMLSF